MRKAVFLATHCPARGHRVNGGPTGRRMRSATPTIDALATHKDLGAYEGDGQNEVVADS